MIFGKIMISEELKTIDSSKIPFNKLISIIFRGQTIYLKDKLEEFGINSTQLGLLFEISHQCNTNQEKIASRCNINKGAVARSIKKLEDDGLVVREIDTDNRRQNKVSLTEKGKDTLNKCIILLNDWEEEVFNEESVKKDELKRNLKEIAIRTIEINEREVKY